MTLRQKFADKFLSSVEGRLKLIILVTGLLIVLGSVTVGGIAFTMRSQFCSSCHEMNPEYYTWQASAHANIGCTDCHIEPGLGNLIKDKLGAMVQVYKHLGHSYDSPIEYPWATKDIPNLVCLKCHSANRQYSPGGDIKIPHDKHIAAGVECVDCHKGVTHGLVAERGISKASKLSFDQWNTAFASQQMAVQFSNPRMDVCVQCHMQRGQSTNCTTCHSQMGVPASHKNQAAWINGGHGPTAEENIAVCDKCHAYGFIQPLGNKKLPAQQYARQNEFCLNCHTKRPANHGTKGDDVWVGSHGPVANSKGVQNCLACHDLRPTTQPAAQSDSTAQQNNSGSINRLITDRPKSEMVNKVYCSQCHGKKFGG